MPAKSTRKRARKAAPPRTEPAPVPITGPERYTVARFLSDCCDETYHFLIEQWAEGNQLEARRVPVDGLPPVVMLTAYAWEYGVELVDDYAALLERYDEHIEEFSHPDKFFSSCISIMAERGECPDPETFESLRIPQIYEELLP